MKLQHLLFAAVFFGIILWKCEASGLNTFYSKAPFDLGKKCVSKDYELTAKEDVDKIDQMAHLVHMVYKDERALRNFECTYCYDFKTKVKLSQGYNAQSKDGNLKERMLYAVNDATKEIVLVFRGDISKPDFRFQHRERYLLGVGTHLNWAGLKDKEIEVNSIAAEKFDILYPIIQSTLHDIIHEHPGYSIVITGHSYGGSLAILTALNGSYANWFPSLTMVVAFQPARLAGISFMNKLESQKIRVLTVIDKNDDVSRWPVKLEWTYLGELHRVVHPHVFYCKKGIFTSECQDLYFSVDTDLIENGKHLFKIIEIHASYRNMDGFFFKLSDILNVLELGGALVSKLSSHVLGAFVSTTYHHPKRKTLESAWNRHFFQI